MPKLAVEQFGGSRPRLASHLLQNTQAALAMDCRFHHGTLDAWRELRTFRSVTPGTRTTAQIGCCWLDFDDCVDWAYGAVGCERIYATGAYEYPVVIQVDPETCSTIVNRLGLPCPGAAPSVLTTATPNPADKDFEGRSYAYQYENTLGERSALSPASDPVLIRDGSVSVISGWAVPDSSWGVANVLIYRTVSATGASMSAPSADNTADTAWMFVGRVPLSSPSMTDSLFNDQLQDALEEDIVLPPPEGLRGITLISSMNALVGYVGNKLYFSENNAYHNWRHHLELDDNICGIVESNKVIYLGTDGAPYAVMGEADCKTAQCRAAVRLPMKWPMVACGNRHMAALAQGAVYPTHDGLVALSGNGMPTLLTNPLYAPEDWQKLRPHTVLPEVHGGSLFVFAEGGSFVLSLDNGAEQGWDLDTHSELSDVGVVDLFTTRSGDLFLLKNNGTLYQWNRGAQLRPYHWRSQLWALPKPVAMAACRPRFKNGSVRTVITADGVSVHDQVMLQSEPFSLPGWAYGTDWQIALRGTATVSLVALATSFKEL